MVNYFKNTKIKVLSILLMVVLFFSLQTNYVKAQSLTENTQLVYNYLDAVKNKDISTIVNLSVDKRVDKSEYRSWLNEIMKNPNQNIESFSLLDKEETYEGYSIVYAEIEFLNGDIFEVPFKVENSTVYVGEFDNPTKLKNGVEIYYQDLSSRAQVTNWSCNLSDSNNLTPDTQYSGKFSYASTSVSLNFRQYTPSYAPVVARVEYAVVSKGIFSDTVLASRIVSGDNDSSPKQITLTIGSGQSFSNTCIRIANQNYSTKTTSFGEAYCY